MSLFQWGNFKLHSGGESFWRIDCDALSTSEIEIFAKLISEKVGRFNLVYYPKSHPGSSVPRLALSLRMNYRTESTEHPRILIVDDVLTTGNSMNELLKLLKTKDISSNREYVGAVMFARGKCPDWITPVFQFSE